MPDVEGTGADLSRRTVVRAGAVAAWATPMVVLATAAPATAATSGPSNVQLSGLTATRTASTVKVRATLTNIGGQASSTLGGDVFLDHSPYATPGDFTTSPDAVVDAPFFSTGGSGDATTYYLSFNSAYSLAPGASIGFSTTITLSPTPGSANVDISFQSGTQRIESSTGFS